MKNGGGMVQVDPPNITWQSGVTDTVDTGAGGDGTCGPAELCARSIEECDVQLDQDTCEAWYDSDDCRDMDAYIACNCACEAAEATCEGSCKGECTVTNPEAGCEGGIRAECEAQAGAMVMCDGRCEGNVEPPSVSAECEASVKAEAKMNVECSPPRLACRCRTGRSRS